MQIRSSLLCVLAVSALAIGSVGGRAQEIATEELTVDEALEAAADALDDAVSAREKDASPRKAAAKPADSAPAIWQPITVLLPQIVDFRDRARALKPKDIAAQNALARDFGLSPAQLRHLLGFLARMDDGFYEDEKRAGLIAAALALPAHTGRAPIATAYAASALGGLREDCTARDFDALMRGTRNRDMDLWFVAAGCTSSDTFATAISQAKESRPVLLYYASDWTSAPPASELAAYDQLLDPALTSLIEPITRTRLMGLTAKSKLSKFFELGMFKEAIVFADSLDPSVLAIALSPRQDEVRTSINGFPLYEKNHYGTASLRTDYAAALALAGRSSEARALLDLAAPPVLRDKARTCMEAAGDNCFGERNSPINLAVMIVDHFLRDAEADPYVLLEAGSGFSSDGGPATSELLCRMLTDRESMQSCESARDTTARSSRSNNDRHPDDDRRLWQVIADAYGQPFAHARDRYAALIASYGIDPPQKAASIDRASIDPAPSPFRELPLPRTALGARPKPAPFPKGVAALPGGYSPIRFERNGSRLAAISISSTFDPNGEISAGGYWLHLSDGRGKGWHTPLYVGLAQYFPYIVPASSRLPMIAGDRIHLEVEEALIDTASITYPPLGIVTRRKRKGIYLDIPIADLGRDSDSDGITDIAERHLLLDQTDPNAPYIVGSDTDCTGMPNSETLARLEILKRLYRVDARAIMEPVDRPTDQIFGGWNGKDSADKSPIFLEGDPADYRCVSIDRPMIVYRSDHREQLRKFSPDFQLISLPPINWNRAGNRGFVNWSMGWTGGTFRLQRTASGWKLTSISEWIT